MEACPSITVGFVERISVAGKILIIEIYKSTRSELRIIIEKVCNYVNHSNWLDLLSYMKYDGSNEDEDDTVRYGKVRHESTKSNFFRFYS